MAAELCTPEAVNFMAKYARGLICMPAAPEIMDKLQFGAMVAKNTDNHETAFSVSIDHVDTTTGISAHERAYTMKNVLTITRSLMISVGRDMFSTACA